MAPDTPTAFQPAAAPRRTATTPPARLNPRALVVAFAVLAAAILGAVWWTADEFAATARSVAARQLATVADLRMEQVADWQNDRNGDARMIHGDTVLGEWIDELFGGIASEDRAAALAARLAALREGYGYRMVALYDREGRLWQSIGDGPPFPSADADLIRRALDSRTIANSDLMVAGAEEGESAARVSLLLHSAIPLHRHGNAEAVGVILLAYDATRALAAYLQGVDASGPRVDLRLVPDQPGETPVLAAGAHLGTLERLGGTRPEAYAEPRRMGEAAVGTRDEGGRPVFAVARAVPDTSWQLVARIDARRLDEANTRERGQLIALALVGLVLVASVLVAVRRDEELAIARTRLAAQASLDESEARFHMFMDNSPAIAFLKDESGRLLYTNAAFRRAFGFDDGGWFGRTTVELWAEETALRLQRNDRMVLDADAPGLFEQEFTDGRGTTVWLVSKFPFRDSAGRRFLGGTAVDITERRRQEEALRRRTMALAASSRCGDLLARNLPEDALLAGICGAIVEETGCCLAWVGFAMDDGARPIRAVALAGADDGHVNGLAMTWDESVRGRGPMGTAIRTGRPAVVHDIRTDPAFQPWRAEAERYGYASVLALPLALGGDVTSGVAGHVIGALCVCAARTDAFGEEEVALFGELAAKLALGIARVRERAERRRVEAALRESEQRYRRLFTGAKAVEMLIDPADGRIVDANHAAEKFYGWPREALTAMRVSEINCLSADEIAREMADARAQDRSHFEFRHRLASGEVRDVEVHAGPIVVGDRELIYSIVHDVTNRRRAERALAETTAALERSNAELKRLAMQDALTGVSNRRHFTAVAERDIALARRRHEPLSLLMIDIDHFKAVNDTHGHAVGDEVLCALVTVMQTVLRATDHLGRHGGEEFVVLLPDTPLEGALASAERLRAAVAAAALIGRDGLPLSCTISIGATEWNPADGCVETTLRRADGALYDAKNAGRNTVRCTAAEAVS